MHEDLLDPLRVKGGQSETVGAVYEEEFTYLSTKTEDFNGITSELSMPETVESTGGERAGAWKEGVLSGRKRDWKYPNSGSGSGRTG